MQSLTLVDPIGHSVDENLGDDVALLPRAEREDPLHLRPHVWDVEDAVVLHEDEGLLPAVAARGRGGPARVEEARTGKRGVIRR